jgi:hypothetical protein
MTSPDDACNPGTPRTGRAGPGRAGPGRAGRRRAVSGHPAPDHAGSVLCRLLIGHPDVVDIEILGQTEILAGITSYSLGVLLPGGRELYIDVEDAPVVPPGAAGRGGATAPPGAAGSPGAAGP